MQRLGSSHYTGPTSLRADESLCLTKTKTSGLNQYSHTVYDCNPTIVQVLNDNRKILAFSKRLIDFRAQILVLRHFTAPNPDPHHDQASQSRTAGVEAGRRNPRSLARDQRAGGLDWRRAWRAVHVTRQTTEQRPCPHLNAASAPAQVLPDWKRTTGRSSSRQRKGSLPRSCRLALRRPGAIYGAPPP